MIKIAICDDEVSIGSQLESYIEKYTKTYEICCEIDVFFTGEALSEYISKDNIYDLIFLDIELRTTDGIKVGKFIRKKFGMEITQIVYISAKEKYALQLFKMRPLDFIIKPITYEAVEEVIKIIFGILNKNKNESFEYSFGKCVYKILIKDIIFFESVNRKVLIHCLDKDEEYYATLKSIFSKVNKFQFIWIHKSYLVNLAYVKKFEYEQITLTNGIILPIAQSKRKQVRNIIMDYENRGITK